MLHLETVLVIDDDPECLEAATDLLQTAGYSVITAANGLQALQELQAGLRPRAMLIDLSMPTMDGRTFCEICDAEPAYATIPRIIVSADRGARAMRYRARAVMPKPINGKLLLDALVRESSLFG
jgi:two-component system, chemotaxis family, chemotaxis protein CheY